MLYMVNYITTKEQISFMSQISEWQQNIKILKSDVCCHLIVLFYWETLYIALL